MSIARYENVDVNNLTFATSSYGETQTTKTLKFVGRPLISDVKNSLAITERYRIYQDLIQMKFNYTPWMKDIVDNQDLYSITWRNKDWRITDTIESNDRMSITLMCYRSDPDTKV
jgi:hypothetical protein